MVGTKQERADVGVGFVSVSDSIDLATAAAGGALAGRLPVFAALERDLPVSGCASE
jgi:hypothetical protein